MCILVKGMLIYLVWCFVYTGDILVVPGTSRIHREVASLECVLSADYKFTNNLPEKLVEEFRKVHPRERTTFFARNNVEDWDFINKCKIDAKMKTEKL